GAFADRWGYAVFVPGKPQESEAYQHITSADPATRMPPPKSGKKLSERLVALLRQWIEQGASWSTHWAFIPPRRPESPPVKTPSWVRNPIDAFILARLEREGLQPAPEADRVTLLRRLSLDLIGLPPTLGELDAAASVGSGWYQQQVTRLLSSPHYGERWARHWLDA